MQVTNPAHPIINRRQEQPTSLTIDLPLPPKELQPNKRYGRDWRGVTKYRTQAKRDAGHACYAAGGPDPPIWRAVVATAVITVRDGREVLDGDNAQGWLKNTVDSIADYLLLNDRQWQWQSITFRVDKTIQPGVVIEIREAI